MRFFISIFGVILIVVSLLLAYQRRNDFPQYIAFLSNRDGNSEVFLLNPETKAAKQLTFTKTPNNDYGHCWFAWTEQSLRIYAKYGGNYAPGDFYCYHGAGDVSQINLWGKVRDQKADEDYIRAPKSPNRDWHITLEYPPNSLVEIYRNHKTSGNHQLIATMGYDGSIDWSKNGDWIVYSYYDATNRTALLYRVRPDGRDLQHLTNPFYKKNECTLFYISPNSEWVYFMQPIEDENAPCPLLYRVKLNGSDSFGETIENVISEPLYIAYDANHPLNFSPDGNYIATWDLQGRYIIVSLKTKEFAYIGKSHIHYYWQSISWSNDGQWLSFASCEEFETNCHIFRVRRDGTDLEQLTFGEHEDVRPEYAPVGELGWRGELPFGIGVLLLTVGVVRKIGVR